MICPNCSKEINDGSQFCPSCGSPIINEAPAVDNAPAFDDVSPQQPEVQMPQATQFAQPEPELVQPVPDTQPSQFLPPEPQLVNKKSNKKTVIIILVICAVVAIVIGSAVAYAIYSGQNQNKPQAVTDVDKKPVVKESKISVSDTWAAFGVAKQKVTYKNAGLVAIRSVYSPKAVQGTFSFTFIDKDSKFKKDDYNYFKSVQIMVDETGQTSLEEQDYLASNDTYEYGALVPTESMLDTVLSKAKATIVAQYPAIGETYAILYVGGESSLSPATWDVYYVQSGQDETTSGYKKLDAYAVRLDNANTVIAAPASSNLSFEIK